MDASGVPPAIQKPTKMDGLNSHGQLRGSMVETGCDETGLWNGLCLVMDGYMNQFH